MADNRELSGRVGCAHRVAVHRRTVERRQVGHGKSRLRNHTTRGARDGDVLAAERFNPLEHEGECVADGGQ